MGKRVQRWSDTQVAAKPPRAHDYTDPGQEGLLLRVRARKSGAEPLRTWLHRYRPKAAKNYTRILIGHYPGTTLAAARAEVAVQRENLSKGIDPRAGGPRRRRPRSTPLPSSVVVTGGDSKHSVDFLVREFTERFLLKNRKRPEYAVRQLERDVVPGWKGRDARSIKHREVVEALDKIVDRGRPVMANRTAALLGQLFRFGMTRGIVESTPVLPYRPGGKERSRERVLSDEELGAFLRDPTACTRHERLARAIHLLLLTGQRRGELARARWREIDLDAKTWTIPDENSKTSRGNVVPLSDWAVEEFRALKAAGGGSRWVLPTINDPKQTPIDPLWLTRRLAKDAEKFEKQKIASFVLHDLRRTLRTGLSKLGVQPHIAERVLGHAQRGIIGVYDRHAYLDEKREALDKWAAHLTALRAAAANSVTHAPPLPRSTRSP